MRKMENIVTVLCVLLACAAILWATGTLRGWLVLAACGIIGILCLRDRTGPDRRVTTLLGVYALLTGVSIGLPKVWAPVPTWVHIVAETSFWGSLVAILSVGWLRRSRDRFGHPAGG